MSPGREGRGTPAPEYLLSFIREDAPFGDITSEAIIVDTGSRAVITTRQSGIIAGLEEAGILFEHFGVCVTRHVADGSEVGSSAVLISLEGPAKGILLVERTALNIIGRMSGIATLTRRMSTLVTSGAPGCRIAATRKTAPGLRLLDKKAVRLGGGDPHRMSLSDGILIKDNHLVLVSPGTAIRRARDASCYRNVEVEVTTPGMAVDAARAGADILLLDNMTPELVRETIRLCTAEGVRDRVVIEVSGGVDEATVLSYAIPGVDRISAGVLTHSVRNFDVTLDIMPGS
ncbi:MAG TPA: carboxylating nicotinate-nucleotide diphosphorylase [Methanoregulaceae archaeon]|jgi:nicotinate-nucleotide pyrophosphorylase (carboxylating)|nr:carboxylating nicotinate-nucleotide diphosphorylase [Methanoregulaceae archaeon]